MTLWSKSYVVHVGIWGALSITSLFLNVWMPIFFALVFIVASLYWTPLGFFAGMEDPHQAMWDSSEISDISTIIWFSFITLVILFLISKAIQKWKSGNKTPMRLLVHLGILVAGALILAVVGSISFPFRT